MGCGKTLTAIAIMGTAYQMGAVAKVLIVSPASICSVWEKELEEYQTEETRKYLENDKM